MAKLLKTKINYKIKKIKALTDPRGWFLEMVKRSEIEDEINQVSIASIKPGRIRGNHFHLKRIEWFVLIGGRGEFCLEDIRTKKRTCFKVYSKEPKVVTVFPGTAHAIKNIGKDIIYFVEAQNDIYNPKKTDKFPYIIYGKTGKKN